MRLNDCALKAGVTPDTLRYYVRIGVVTPEGRTVGGYRTFSQRSITRVHFVRSALTLGFTLNEVSELVAMSERGDSPCPRARSLLIGRLESQRDGLAAAQILYRRMQRAVRSWDGRPGSVPDGRCVRILVDDQDAAHGAVSGSPSPADPRQSELSTAHWTQPCHRSDS